WSAGALSLLVDSSPWPEVDRPRRAGVSSFGAGGTNAHVILEQPTDPMLVATDPAVLLPALPWVLSARTEAALRAQAGRLAELFGTPDPPQPLDIGFSLATARAGMPCRSVVVGADSEELLVGLAALAAGRPAPSVSAGTAVRAGRTVFVFPGQGSHWVGMGRE